MAESKTKVLVVGGDCFEAFQVRASHFTSLEFSNGHEAVTLERELNSALVVLKMNADGIANGQIVKEKAENCKLIFYSDWGNDPHFRQRLDELGFEAAHIIPRQFLLKYANEVLWSVAAKEHEKHEEYDSRRVLEAKVNLSLAGSPLWEALAGLPELPEPLAWRELEDLVWDLIQPFGCVIHLAKRTKDGEIDALSIAERGRGFGSRGILQAKRLSNTVVVEPISQLLFFRAGHKCCCSATTASYRRQDCEPAADRHWELELWDYSELKDWTLRQGWWGT